MPSPDSSSREAKELGQENFGLNDFNHPVIIEMFCGTSRVTACLKAIRLSDSFGVDHVKSKAISTMKVADLSTKVGQELFLEWLDSPLVKGAFIAPPCGTCSLVRCIKLRDEKGRLIPGPVPLRSQSFPEGLANLSRKNLIRVSLANKLYDFVGKVVKLALKKGLIVVENPRSSLFWATRSWRECNASMYYTLPPNGPFLPIAISNFVNSIVAVLGKLQATTTSPGASIATTLLQQAKRLRIH